MNTIKIIQRLKDLQEMIEDGKDMSNLRDMLDAFDEVTTEMQDFIEVLVSE